MSIVKAVPIKTAARPEKHDSLHVDDDDDDDIDDDDDDDDDNNNNNNNIFLE